MFRRRRPLARAAVVGGAAYAIGKNRARNEMEQEYAEPVAESAGGMSQTQYEELEKLGRLKEQGILTQEEFDAQKAKILQGF
jgi:Short C-terminal domain